MDGQARSTTARCAIYTRKSVIGQYDPEYNSTETQRDICSSYVRSQKHRGWRELPTRYDDLGQSGGTLERPAMQALISDIERGLVDIVVLYKIDRLTRSLRDFMKLLELFERHGVGFVSITQSFDTSDTLGRLVLNILLTFAQFEREMHADRIRDKQLAMKRRGLWTGGIPPYGYDIVQGRLVINEVEAAVVRRIFDRFILTRSYGMVRRELEADGIRSKAYVTKDGRKYGDTQIAHATIHHIIKNPFCVGDVPTSDGPIPGQHQPIIDRETWQRAQNVRLERSAYKIHIGPSPNVLLGIVCDALGRPMTIADGLAKGRRYRYYISSTPAWARKPPMRRFRANADRLESLVKTAVSDAICDRERMRSTLIQGGVHGPDLDRLGRRGVDLVHLLTTNDNDRTAALLKALVGRIEVGRDQIRLVLRNRQLERFLRWNGKGFFKQDQSFGNSHEPTDLLTVPLSVIRCQRQLILPTAGDVQPRRPNRGLTKLLDEAREAKRLNEVERLSMTQIASRLHKRTGSTASRILRLNYLAPDIIGAILDGSQPPGLTRKQLVHADLPLDWALQRRMFGFEERAPMQLNEQRY
ncbi:MAG: recombinase family protein [Pseudomonadota bacterium]|nr:recombinase family protein [Pseudomonadota bacterium]